MIRLPWTPSQEMTIRSRIRRLAQRLVIRGRIAAIRLGFTIGVRMPLRARVVFASSHDPTLRGNLAVLRDRLATAHPQVALVVHAHGVPRGTRSRLRGLVAAVRAGYLLATSRVTVVDDYFLPIYVVTPRPGTTIVQTWHATGAFKKFGYSVLDKSFGVDARFVARVSIHQNYDVCLVSSAAMAPFYADAFRLPEERFTARYGIPRTDVLLDPVARDRAVEDVRRRYRLPPGRRVVLYAPTFRGDSIGAATAGPLVDLRVLRDTLADDHVLLLRLHPFVREAVAITPDLAEFVRDASAHPDANALLLASDVLVTDYSSLIFEFALLGRPMVFFAPDLDEYEAERGFYFDYRSGVPGPVVDTSAGVAAAIRAGDPDPARVEAFARWAFDVADGHATERVVEELILPRLRA